MTHLLTTRGSIMSNVVDNVFNSIKKTTANCSGLSVLMMNTTAGTLNVLTEVSPVPVERCSGMVYRT